MERMNRIIFMRDFDDPESQDIQNYLDTIRDKNEQLYKRLLRILKRSDFTGMRKDVLQCLADNADSIAEDSQFVFHLLSLIDDRRITPDYYIWLIEYCKNTTIDISDIMASLSVAIDNGMPLHDIQECFENDDFLIVFERIEKYSVSGMPEDDRDVDVNESDIKEVSLPLQKDNNEDNSLVSVFGDLLTIMTMGKRSEESEIASVRERFDEIVSALRQNVNNASSFFGGIIHEWDMDKEEILRLKAIYNIQQRALSKQHQKIYEAEQEISRLRVALQEAEKRELQYETINKKVREIQTLTASTIDGGDIWDQ